MSVADAPVPSAMPPAMPLAPRRRGPWLTFLLCLAIFAAGAVVGGGITVIHVYRSALSALEHPERMPARIAARMQRKQGMTPPTAPNDARSKHQNGDDDERQAEAAQREQHRANLFAHEETRAEHGHCVSYGAESRHGDEPDSAHSSRTREWRRDP